MLSPKIPENVKFSTAASGQSFDIIIHGSDYCTLGPEEEELCYGPMIRDYNVIRYCVSGKGTLVLNDKTYTVSPGQSYALLPGDVAYETYVEAPFTMAFVTLLGIKAPLYISKMGVSSQQPFFNWDECPEFLSEMDRIIKTVGNSFPSPNSEFSRCAEAYNMLNVLQNVLLKQEKPMRSTEYLQEQYVSAALDFMELNFTQKISVSDIAAHIGINRSYFYSLFKQHTGLSPQEHLTRLRISKACDLFAYPHSTVVNVANALNLESSVFFRHFKRITGKTPSEYKQALHKK